MSLLDRIKADIETDEDAEVNELGALLRYSQVPTLVVEGISDVRIYSRWVARQLLGTYKVDVLSANGRVNLLNLYKRRNEFVHAPVVFILDRDMWLFSEMPERYEDIVWTQGYSIENDLYSVSRIESLVDRSKVSEHWQVKEAIIKWFASEVQAAKGGMFPKVKMSLDTLVPRGSTKVDKKFLRPMAGTEVTDKIHREFRLNLPGKLLFEMVGRFSSVPLHSLYALALADYESSPRELIQEIRAKLGKQNSVSSQKDRSPVPREEIVKPVQPENIDISFRSADELINKLETDRQTVIIEHKVGPFFDWWVAQLDAYLKPRKIGQQGKSPKIFSIIGEDEFLSLYERRKEFLKVPVAFVGNQAMRSFSGIPERYEDIIWTQGYDLESDLYAEADLERLLFPHEIWKHKQVRNSVIEWFAFEAKEVLEGRREKTDMDFELSDIVPEGALKLDKGFCQRRGFHQPPPERVQEIRDNYKLPGKFLFQILIRFLNSRDRDLDVTGLDLYNLALATPNLHLPLKKKIEQKLDTQMVKLIPLVRSLRSSKKKNEINTPYSRTDKLVDNLKKVNTPTVIIERGSDSRFDWWVAQLDAYLKPRKIGQQGKSPKIFSIIGEDEFLSLYERRKEFLKVPVAFVGNQAMRSFSGIPERYEDIIWTQGYDLESDLYAEADLERLLFPHEIWKHKQVRNSVIEWFAFEAKEVLEGRREKTDMDFELSDIVPEGALKLDKGFCQRRGFHQPPPERVQEIRDNYKLPGKFLFQILIRFLNSRDRDFNFYDVTERDLYDIALAMPNLHLPLNNLIEKIEQKLDTEEKRTTVLWIPKVRKGERVNATILKKEDTKIPLQSVQSKVTVQLQTGHKEKIVFTYHSYYHGKVGDSVRLKVTETDDTGRVSKVVP